MQTTIRTEERLGRPGCPYDSNTIDEISRIAEVAAFRPGDLAIRGTSTDGAGKTIKKLVAPAAADDDAIMTVEALAAGAETNSGAALDGVIGAGRIFPPRNITLGLNSHADWDLSTITVRGLDEYGRVQEEDFTAPDAGNVTLTGKKFFSSVLEIATPAGSGTNRTLDAGIGTLLGPLTGLDAIGLVRYIAARQVASTTAEYAINDVLVVITKGRVWVEVEEDVVDGEQAFVRLVATGGEVVGGFRNDRDGTAAAPDAVPVAGMRFVGDSEERDSVKMAVVELALPNI